MLMYAVTLYYGNAGETRWLVRAAYPSEARMKVRELARRDHGLNDPLHDGFVIPSCATQEGRLFPPTLAHRRRWKLQS
jgi:hypothetical protein